MGFNLLLNGLKEEIGMRVQVTSKNFQNASTSFQWLVIAETFALIGSCPEKFHITLHIRSVAESVQQMEADIKVHFCTVY
jgi:hypothetical protein